MITHSEYTKIYHEAYRPPQTGKGWTAHSELLAGRKFLKLINEALEEHDRKACPPHRCRVEKRKTMIRGEKYNVEYRH